jgi:hypothetical protein
LELRGRLKSVLQKLIRKKEESEYVNRKIEEQMWLNGCAIIVQGG